MLRCSGTPGRGTYRQTAETFPMQLLTLLLIAAIGPMGVGSPGGGHWPQAEFSPESHPHGTC